MPSFRHSPKQLEQTLLEILSSPVPEPKYKLWQQTKHGIIVGLQWESVSYAYQNTTRPGWVYVLEEGWDRYFVHEDDIVIQ